MSHINTTIYHNLLGVWHLKRRVQTAHTSYNFSGQANFANRADGLHYQESCQTLHRQQNLQSYQSYYYCLETDASQTPTIVMYFCQNQQKTTRFQQLDFKQQGAVASANATHQCLADHYASYYEMQHATHYYNRHRVTGPRKDYVVETWLEKLR